MKYIKLYEKFEKYFELDISKLLIGFIKLLKSENESVDILNKKFGAEWRKVPVFTIFELIIRDFLKHNEIKFYDKYKMQVLIVKVKEIEFNYLNIPIDDDFIFIVRSNEYDSYYVDYTKPIHIKAKPTKIIEYIDMYSDIQNFNL